MKSYLLPVGLASLGVVTLLHFKGRPEQSMTVPEVPRSRATHLRSETAPVRTTPIKSIKRPNGSNTSVMKTTTSAFDRPYQFFHERLTHLNNCLESRNCKYPQRDPRAYETAVHDETETTLRTLLNWQKRHHYRDSRIPQLMTEFLKFEKTEVKQIAIEILGTQPTHPAVLESLLENVIQHPQPDAVAPAMAELARYRSRQDRARIDAVVEETLLYGGIFSAVEVAKNMAPLITPQNRSRYTSILRTLQRTPLTEDIAEALAQALDP